MLGHHASKPREQICAKANSGNNANSGNANYGDRSNGDSSDGGNSGGNDSDFLLPSNSNTHARENCNNRPGDKGYGTNRDNSTNNRDTDSCDNIAIPEVRSLDMSSNRSFTSDSSFRSFGYIRTLYGFTPLSNYNNPDLPISPRDYQETAYQV
jgi:hypothetical protein